jgi:hypothetical protein
LTFCHRINALPNLTPHLCRDLTSFRERYIGYRTKPNVATPLVALHAQHPSPRAVPADYEH